MLLVISFSLLKTSYTSAIFSLVQGHSGNQLSYYVRIVSRDYIVHEYSTKLVGRFTLD